MWSLFSSFSFVICSSPDFRTRSEVPLAVAVSFSGNTLKSFFFSPFRMTSFPELLLAGLEGYLELVSFRSSGAGGFSSFVTDGSGFTIVSLFFRLSLSELSSGSVWSSLELILVWDAEAGEGCDVGLTTFSFMSM